MESCRLPGRVDTSWLPPYPAVVVVQSIERAFLLLRYLALGPLGVTELAERTDLPKSTVARLLTALETEGAVEQDETGGVYRLGPGLVDIAGRVTPGRNLIAAARPYLLELAETVGELAGLSIPSGGEVYYLDQTESHSEVQVRDWTGERLPLHIVSSGLVILAYMPEAEREEYLAGPLERYTARTMIDPDALRKRFEHIRSIGYVWVYGEFVEELHSVAVAVLGADGHAQAALHVHGPAYRFPDPDRAHDFGMAVARAAESLAAQLNA